MIYFLLDGNHPSTSPKDKLRVGRKMTILLLPRINGEIVIFLILGKKRQSVCCPDLQLKKLLILRLLLCVQSTLGITNFIHYD